GVRDAAKVLKNEVLNHTQILADSRRTNLFVVADDEHGLAQIQGDKGHHIALAGFIDDDNVKTSSAGVEVFHHARERHDPDGDSATARAHFPGSFGAQEGNSYAVTFANATDGIEPADERLTLFCGGAPCLRTPRAFVDEFYRRAAQLFA